MTSNRPQIEPLEKMPSLRRTRLNMKNLELIRQDSFLTDRPFPLIMEPAVSGLDPIVWAANNADFIGSQLSTHGAILFRGFGIETVDTFNQLVTAISGPPLEYRERSSPRSNVGGRIYTSTDYPADQTIFPHNEHSYAQTFPLKLYFYCKQPATEGGETPIADCRRILERLDARLRDRFVEKKWMYVRNFGDGFGLSWKIVFQTDVREKVEDYCRANHIRPEWKHFGRLRTRQVRPPIIKHPRTGEMSWFNHATFFNISTLPLGIQHELLAEFQQEDLPNNTYYGDGSMIESEVLDELRAAYLEESVSFSWQKGDVILLDNILSAHARNWYVGPRQILFAMAEPYTRPDIRDQG